MGWDIIIGAIIIAMALEEYAYIRDMLERERMKDVKSRKLYQEKKSLISRILSIGKKTIGDTMSIINKLKQLLGIKPKESKEKTKQTTLDEHIKKE